MINIEKRKFRKSRSILKIGFFALPILGVAMLLLVFISAISSRYSLLTSAFFLLPIVPIGIIGVLIFKNYNPEAPTKIFYAYMTLLNLFMIASALCDIIFNENREIAYYSMLVFGEAGALQFFSIAYIFFKSYYLRNDKSPEN